VEPEGLGLVPFAIPMLTYLSIKQIVMLFQ
jgi:hypothetical protein